MPVLSFLKGGFFKGRGTRHVGVDIGTASVKVVELAKDGSTIALETYGELEAYGYLRKLQESVQLSSLKMLESDVAGMIKELFSAARVRGKRASMAIPVFSSFFSLLELPVMKESELVRAIPFQARQIVPVPIGEVILDWEIVGKSIAAPDAGQPQQKLLVLIVAVPREVVDKYVRIAKLANIELSGLEVETFSLVRTLVFERTSGAVMIVDFGARATSLTIVDGGSVRASRSIDIGGAELTRAIAHSLGVGTVRAETMKLEQGIAAQGGEAAIMRVLTTIMSSVVQEVDKSAASYFRKYGQKIGKVILTGGSAPMKGLASFLADKLARPVEIAFPFSHIKYQAVLEPTLHEIGPAFTVAVGLALRELVPKSPPSVLS